MPLGPSVKRWSSSSSDLSRGRYLIALGLLSAVALASYLLAFPRPTDRRPVFSSPRQNVGYVLDQRFSEGHGFTYPLAYADVLPSDIAVALTPRDAASLDGQVVPKDFAGTMLFYAPAFAVWAPLVLFITPVFSVLSGLGLAWLGTVLFSRRVALAAFVLWMTYPPMIINGSAIFMSDTVALFFLLLACVGFVNYWRARRLRDLILISLCGGLAILVRYPSAWIVVPLLLSLLVTGRLGWRRTILSAALLAPFVVAIGVFDQLVYGSFLLTGYQIRADIMHRTLDLRDRGFLAVDWTVALSYLRLYLFDMPMQLAPEVLGLVVGLLMLRRARERTLWLGLLVSGVLLALFQLPRPTWGAFTPVVNASLTRYLLPATAVWTVFLAAGLARVGRRTYLPIVSALVILNLVTAAFGAGGLVQRFDHTAAATQLQARLLSDTPPDALIATRLEDKYLWPERQTLTLTYLIHNTEPVQQGNRYQWAFVPTGRRFASVARRVVSLGIPLYLLPDFYPKAAARRTVASYTRALQVTGLRLCRVSQGSSLLKVVAFEQRCALPP